MSNQPRFDFTTPVGRIVGGDVMKKRPAMDDRTGQPILIKTGNNQGQPRTDYSVGLAIPKTAGVDWKNEPWGQQIVAAAKHGFPHLFGPDGAQLNPSAPFSWKVIDGDSQVPNQSNRKPCENQGYPGNWVVWFATSGAMARLYHWDNNQATPLPEGMQIKKGYFAQINGTVDPNGSTQSPGVYIGPNMICMMAYGEEIVSGVDVSEAGFGVGVNMGALPPGASTTPVGGMPTGTTPPPAQQQTPPPPPANDLVNTPPPPPAQEERYEYGGQVKTKSEWLAIPGYTEAHLAAMTKV